MTAKLILVSPVQASRFKYDHIELSDQLLDSITHEGQDQTIDMASPSSAALGILTSGSTGTPKTSIIEHRHYVLGAFAHAASIDLSSDSRVLQFASHSFDVSMLEILTTLMFGGTVCVPHQDGRLENLEQTINQSRATLAVLTPTVVATALEHATLPTLRTLVLTGEPCTAALIAQWSPRLTLINGCAPSECTPIIAATPPLRPAADPRCIGAILAGCCAVVSPRSPDRPLPRGAVGELCICGPTVARGYLNDDARTAHAFLDTPAWAPPQWKRCYRTGDLAQIDERGRIVLLGRADGQRKLRGQRLELGEVERCVEAVLLDRRVVVNAVAELVEMEAQSGSALVCFVVAKDGEGVGEEKGSQHQQHVLARARHEVAQRLPGYMVPTALIPLRSMPLLPSGKADRRALRAIASQVSAAGLADHRALESREAPRGPAEVAMAQLWAKVLRVKAEDMDRSATFLGLGGDSIGAMRVVALARARGWALRVADLLGRQRLHVMAQAAQEKAEEGGILISMDPSECSNEGQLFALSPIQRMFFELSPQGCKHFNQSLLLKISDNISADFLHQALGRIVERHAALRTRFGRGDDGHWQQWVADDMTVPFDAARFGTEQELRDCTEDLQMSLDVEGGPLFAARAFVATDEKTPLRLLFLTAHHLVIDLVSWSVIRDDLCLLLRGQTLKPSASTSFQTWCCRQAARVSHSLTLPPRTELPRNLGYWGMDGIQNTFGDAVTLEVSLDRHQTDLLLGAANKALHTSPLEILSATLIMTFAQTFQDRKVPPIFLEGHGREPEDVDVDVLQTVGWFTAVYPLQVPTLGSSKGILDWLRCVKDVKRKFPRNGADWFASATLGNGRERIQWPVELLLNYYSGGDDEGKGDPDVPLHNAPIHLDPRADVSPSMPRMALLEISVMPDAAGCLSLSFQFNRLMRHRDLIERWFRESVPAALQANLSYLAAAEPELTMADFTFAPFTSHEALVRFTNVELPKRGLRIADVEDAFPCSATQQGILIGQTKRPMDYLVEVLWKVHGNVDPERLGQAWRVVVARHGSMRTVFFETDGSFYQVILRSPRRSVYRFDLDDEAFDEATILQRSPSPFYGGGNDDQSPHCLTLWSTRGGRHIYAALKISHALIDGHSMDVLLRDWKMAYERGLSTANAPLYRDFVLQQASSDAVKADLAFWEKYLEGSKPCLFPSAEKPGASAGNRERLRKVQTTLPFSQDLRGFCRRHNLTLAALSRVAWAVVLRRYTGMSSVVFGYLHSGRDADMEGIQDAVGVFISMLISKVELHDNASFESVLQQAQNDYLESIQHSNCSLAEIQHRLGDGALINSGISVQSAPKQSTSATEGRSVDFNAVQSLDPTEVRIAHLHFAPCYVVADTGAV